MKRVNISLKGDVHTKAKVIAVLTGVSLNDYLERAVEAQLKKDTSILKKLGGEEK